MTGAAYLRCRHSGDASQLAVIDSEERRVYVTAPAGYGKTRTMTTKAIQLLVTGAVPYPKRILCLTFSVNAARGMRVSISAALDELAPREMGARPIDRSRLLVANYHGLSRMVIRMWARAIGLSRALLDALRVVDDVRAKKAGSKGRYIGEAELKTIDEFCSALTRRDVAAFDSLIGSYMQIVLTSLVPRGLMTYNGLLVLAVNLLQSVPAAREHLRILYPCVIVDEAQDMNLLHWRLLNLVQSDSGRLLMFGDPVQRIYGFLGAIPRLEAVCERDLGTVPMALLMSHRFESDSCVGRVERCVRAAASGFATQSPVAAGEVQVLIAGDEIAEGALAARLANYVANNSAGDVAILFRTRSCNSADGARYALRSKGVGYFDGLLDENDPEYDAFNELCIQVVEDNAGNSQLSCREAGGLLERMIDETQRARFVCGEAYVLLLGAFKRQLATEFRHIDPAERYDLVYRTFSEHALRNAAGYLDTRISLMTVHAAKGLEWDTVIIPDMQQYGFPGGRFCYNCAVDEGASAIAGGRNCVLKDWQNPPSGYGDELNVFYVAVSRARKSLYLGIADTRVTGRGAVRQTLRSCLLQIPGLKLNRFDDSSFQWGDGW
ncbi:MAG: ATP-dependent helicase [Eggerthellaceae bacterium]|nr:ATP-dependent helicase [Eggerthellaceae bacterium]